MDTKSSKRVHLVEGGTNGPQYVNMAPMGKTSLGRVAHSRKRQKTSFTNFETHGDGSGCLACDTCSSGVPKEIVPAGIVPIGNILVGNKIGFQTRTKGSIRVVDLQQSKSTIRFYDQKSTRRWVTRPSGDYINQIFGFLRLQVIIQGRSPYLPIVAGGARALSATMGKILMGTSPMGSPGIHGNARGRLCSYGPEVPCRSYSNGDAGNICVSP